MQSGPRSGFYYALASVPLMIAGIYGPDVFHASAQTKEAIFFLCLAAAFIMIIIGATKEIRDEAESILKPGHRRRVIAVWGMAVCGAGFIVCAGLYFWPVAPMQAIPDIAGEFEGMYATDFSDLMNTQTTPSFEIKDPENGLDTKQEIRFRVYYDFRANTDFVSVFIPTFSDLRMNIFHFIYALRDQIPKLRTNLKATVGVGSSSPGVPYTEAKDLTFSGRVFIYTLNSLNMIETGQLVSYYREADMFLEIRSNDYYWFHRKH